MPTVKKIQDIFASGGSVVGVDRIVYRMWKSYMGKIMVSCDVGTDPIMKFDSVVDALCYVLCANEGTFSFDINAN